MRLPTSGSLPESIVVGLPNGGRARVRLPPGAQPGSTLNFDASPAVEPVSVMASISGLNEFEIIVPQVPPRATLKAMTPHGVGVVVPLPPGAQPGSTIAFSATIPPSMRKIPAAPATPTSPNGREFEVSAPSELSEGERFRALLPSGEAILVTVPVNGAGKTLLFDAPKHKIK